MIDCLAGFYKQNSKHIINIIDNIVDIAQDTHVGE